MAFRESFIEIIKIEVFDRKVDWAQVLFYRDLLLEQPFFRMGKKTIYKNFNPSDDVDVTKRRKKKN